MSKQKTHWDNIYSNKGDHEVSWTELSPSTSIALIDQCKINHSSHIIDIGGGNSRLPEYLLSKGMQHISVLDISTEAIKRAQTRLKSQSHKVTWINEDMLRFSPNTIYDIWHDRAAFHFLTNPEDIKAYVTAAAKGVKPGGHLIISAFSTNGPEKCSGLPITQYNSQQLQITFGDYFDLLQTQTIEHNTPFNTTQEFVYSLMTRK